jgi:enolase
LPERAANAIIIKPDQAGTVTATLDCLKLAQTHNYKIIVAGRSGETIDNFIVDLAVASGADYLKAGSLSRGERVSKYNRLLEIAELIK